MKGKFSRKLGRNRENKERDVRERELREGKGRDYKLDVLI